MDTSISEKPIQHALNFEEPNILKRCCTCEQSLPATSEYFNIDHRAPSGFMSQCRQCRRTKRRKTPFPEAMEEGMKRCAWCKEVFPATLEFFSRHKKGLRSHCRTCANTPKVGPVYETKRCTKCEQEFPTTTDYFQKNRLNPDGLTTRCKTCCSLARPKEIIPEGYKKCKKCMECLPVTEFYLDTKKRGRIFARCKKCTLPPPPNRPTFKFGMTLEQYNEMFEKQNGVCAVCKQPENWTYPSGEIRRLCVDHDHGTGKIRKLLCHSCNVSLGLMKEDPERIRALVDYAEWCQLLRA